MLNWRDRLLFITLVKFKRIKFEVLFPCFSFLKQLTCNKTRGSWVKDVIKHRKDSKNIAWLQYFVVTTRINSSCMKPPYHAVSPIWVCFLLILILLEFWWRYVTEIWNQFVLFYSTGWAMLLDDLYSSSGYSANISDSRHTRHWRGQVEPWGTGSKIWLGGRFSQR